ncbi:MAG: hypothetical protein SGILL_005558 [Bacillariaceae sp.]
MRAESEDRNAQNSEESPAVAAETQFKIHIARVPTKFDEAIVRRILQDKLKEEIEGDDVIVKTVELIYPREDVDGEAGNEPERKDTARVDKADKEHRGFGFVSFNSQNAMEAALELGTTKVGRKATSKKLYTMHLRPYQDKIATEKEGDENDEQTNNLHNVCYLWSLNRCPYGDDCKFRHIGPGGCVNDNAADMDPNERLRKKKGKCFAFKKGKCDKGDDCPYSHDVVVVDLENKESSHHKDIPTSEKDCINWKTKGKCRKGEKCPYRHDPELQQRALDKKKRKRQEEGDNEDSNKKRKEKQPLAVRVFGMPYACTEQDVRDLFAQCGTIQKIVFPIFEDSGRSKGFCGVWFVSPKATEQALKLDGAQMHDRWIRIQRGKTMDVSEWEKLHQHHAVQPGRD